MCARLVAHATLKRRSPLSEKWPPPAVNDLVLKPPANIVRPERGMGQICDFGAEIGPPSDHPLHWLSGHALQSAGAGVSAMQAPISSSSCPARPAQQG